MIFLVQYDRRAGRLVRFERYADADRSMAERGRLALELSLIGNPKENEVVLFESESEEALRHTHGRYFESISELMAPAGLPLPAAQP
ncbi:MAG TPA: hypothetical protein VGM81_19995 [Burkholderiaceae bacterium]|jgi:hypothetical protein